MTPPPLGKAWCDNQSQIYREKGENFSITEYVNICRRVASQANVPLIDHFADWQSQPQNIDTLLTDGCHPNAAGNARMALTMEPKLMRLIGSPTRSKF